MKDIVSPPVRGAEKPYGKEWEKHAMRHPKMMADVIRRQGKRIVELVRERDALQAEVADAMNRAAAGPLLRALQGLRDRGMIDVPAMARAAERLPAEYPEHEAGHGAGSVTDKEAAGDPGRSAPRPCPACGGKATATENLRLRYWEIGCQNPACADRPQAVSTVSMGDAVKYWNTRRWTGGDWE